MIYLLNIFLIEVFFLSFFNNIYTQNIHDILAYNESKKNVGDNILVTVLRNGIIQFNTVKIGSNPNYFPELKK
jgi:hypothetical protein